MVENGADDSSDPSVNCKVTASLKFKKKKKIISLCRVYGKPTIFYV